MGTKKLTTEEFISKSELVHNKKYDYSLVDYKNNKSKIKIICPKHGEFIQRASAHIAKKRAQGCPSCDKSKKLTTSEFVRIAKEIHGNTYSYEKTIYKSTRDYVTITCLKHGDFKQIARIHMHNKCGCPKCSFENRSMSKENIINELKNKFENKYKYSLENYENLNSEITFICFEHGEFTTKANVILQTKHGCPKCAINQTSKNNSHSNEKFIASSKNIHRETYDYSKVEYNGNKEKVRIICPKHGEFLQTPSDHKQGKGCSKCRTSKGENKIMNHLKNKNINFKYSHRFDDCRYKLPLPFDFYLPDYNMCIEYDGEQHFKEINIWGGLIELKQRKIRDEIKNEYCIKNNIRLLRIKYNENVTEVLDTYL